MGRQVGKWKVWELGVVWEQVGIGEGEGGKSKKGRGGSTVHCSLVGVVVALLSQLWRHPGFPFVG